MIVQLPKQTLTSAIKAWQLPTGLRSCEHAVAVSAAYVPVARPDSGLASGASSTESLKYRPRTSSFITRLVDSLTLPQRVWCCWCESRQAEHARHRFDANGPKPIQRFRGCETSISASASRAMRQTFIVDTEWPDTERSPDGPQQFAAVDE